jgi:hypothetical protein
MRTEVNVAVTHDGDIRVTPGVIQSDLLRL